MGLYPENWPVPFTTAGVKKGNKQHATKMVKEKVEVVEEGSIGHKKKKENDVVDVEEEEEEVDVDVEVGSKIKMYIKAKQTYHVALVIGITPTRKHQLKFNNGKKQTVDLSEEKFVLLAAPDADTVAANNKKKAAAPTKKPPSLPPSPTKKPPSVPASPTKQATNTNKILPESALKRALPTSHLPPITFSSRPVTWSHERALTGLTSLLSTLRRYPSQWIGRSTLREAAAQDGLKDGGLLDYLCRSLENVVVDGLAVHRVMHLGTKTWFYLAEDAGRVGIHIEDILPPGGGGGVMKSGGGETKKQEEDEEKKEKSKGKEPAVNGTIVDTKDNGGDDDDDHMLALQQLQHQPRVSLRRIQAATAAAADAEAGPSTKQPAFGTKFKLVISKNNNNNNNNNGALQQQQQQHLPESETSIRAKQDEALKFLLKLQKWPWVVKKGPGRPLTHPFPSLSLAAAATHNNNILVPPPPTAPQPWQDPPPQPRWAVLLPGVLPPSTDGTIQGISKELIKDQVMRDLAHLYFTVLPGKTFGPPPVPLTKAQQKKRDRAAAAGGSGGGWHQLPPGLQKLQEHVQILKDVKHFIKEFPSGVHPENVPHRPPPPNSIMQVLCKLQMPKMAHFDGYDIIGRQQQQQHRAGGGGMSRSLSHHTRLPRAIEPPPELITVGPIKSTTVGDMKAAATRAFSETYVAFDGIQVTTIEAGVQKQQQGGSGGGGDKVLLTSILPVSHHHHHHGSGSQGAAVKKPQLLVVGGVQGLPADAWTSRAGGPEDWVVHCTCGTQDDDGEAMFICDKCHTWMHLRCQGYGTGDNDNGPGSGENWVCTMCAKRSRIYK